MAGHVAPKRRGGPIAVIAEGDSIVFDLDARKLQIELSDAEIKHGSRNGSAGGTVQEREFFANMLRW